MRVVQAYPSRQQEVPVILVNLLVVFHQVGAQYKGKEKLHRVDKVEEAKVKSMRQSDKKIEYSGPYKASCQHNYKTSYETPAVQLYTIVCHFPFSPKYV